MKQADMAEQPRCDRCRRVYTEAGDGWDGKCPDCADIIEMERENNRTQKSN